MLNRSNSRINYFKYFKRSKYQSVSSPYYFGYGRTALKIGLLSCNIPSGKKILVPNYICAAVLDPINELGLEVIYYPVKEDLSANWSAVKKMLSKDFFAIVMVHYFGIPQDIDAFINFSNENNLLLIEDNSHGHGGLFKNKLLGEFGDIGISSPRKSFPILNGGILFLNRGHKLYNCNFPLEPSNISKSIIRNSIGQLLDNAVTVKNLFLENLNESGSEVYFNEYSIDKASFKLLVKFNLREACNVRTEIFKVWEKWCKANYLNPIFSLNHSNYAPLSFPILFSEKMERDKWLRIFNANHIAAYLWPDLPKKRMNTTNSGCSLYDRTLCLPIHLSMKADNLEDFLFNKFVPHSL